MGRSSDSPPLHHSRLRAFLIRFAGFGQPRGPTRGPSSPAVLPSTLQIGVEGTGEGTDVELGGFIAKTERNLVTAERSLRGRAPRRELAAAHPARRRPYGNRRGAAEGWRPGSGGVRRASRSAPCPRKPFPACRIGTSGSGCSNGGRGEARRAPGRAGRWGEAGKARVARRAAAGSGSAEPRSGAEAKGAARPRPSARRSPRCCRAAAAPAFPSEER